MPSVTHRAFSDGELSPALAARADLQAYARGLSLLRNAWVKREGGVQNRTGTKFVAAAGNEAQPVRLIPFVFEGADQTYVIEMGHNYLRWFYHGAPVVVSGVAAYSGATSYVVGDLVVSGGINYYCIAPTTGNAPPNATYWYALTGDIYEIPTPYIGSDLAAIQFIQSADVITLTHPSYAPRELRRVATTNWQLATVTTAPSISAPTGGSGTPGAAGSRTFKYVVTAIRWENYEESVASAAITVSSSAPPDEDAPIALSWDAHPDADEYAVYSDGGFGNGVYGWIGFASSNAFNDPKFTPDFTQTPPVNRNLFSTTDNYPAVATYYQQRRFFANTNTYPDRVWGSRIGNYSNFSSSSPIRDDDSIEFTLASRELHPVRALVGLKRLLLLTDRSEWIIRGDEAGTITPVIINADQEGYIGTNKNVRPVALGNSIIYVQAVGHAVRELAMEMDPSTFGGRDLSLKARHLFEDEAIVSMAFQQEPNSIIWIVRQDGMALAGTYVREESIIAWSQHYTGLGGDGAFEHVCCVPDSSLGEDVVWFVVRRTIDGATRRYIEYLPSRLMRNNLFAESAHFVDCGLTYDGAPATVITGLDHLEGEEVQVVADGAPVGGYVVSSGQITLGAAASVVHAGFGIEVEVQTLDIDADGSQLKDRRKRVHALTAVLESSWPQFKAGPNSSTLADARPEPWVAASPAIKSGQVEVHLTSGFENTGRVYLKFVTPMPWHLLAIVPQLEVGG